MHCPICIERTVKLYELRQSLQHAEGIWISSKRKSKERGDHLALARYLKDIVPGDHVRVLGNPPDL